MRLLEPDLIPPAPVWMPPDRDTVTLRLDLKTMTPVFGGGHTAREVDQTQAVRPSAIRGQLRYWWRATAGAKYASTSELFKAEAALFGSTDKAGVVRVRVPRISAGTPVPYDKRWPGNPNATRGPEERVFVFPFQRNLQQPAADFLDGIEFHLEVTAPANLIHEIKGALQAWLVFGGVGSRTRRGCGSLMLTNAEQRRSYLPPSPNVAAGEATRAWLEKLVYAGKCGPDWTKLDGAGVICDSADPYTPAVVNDIWRDLGSFWSAVRKNHIYGQEYKPIGKTLWPDHRRLSEVRGREAKLVLGKAFYGLPIIYQQGRGFKGQLTPDKEYYGGTRAASPVILKPLMYADGSVSAMVAVLKTPAVKLKYLKAGENINVEVSPTMPDDIHPLMVVIDAADNTKDNALLRGKLLQIRGKRTDV